MANCETACGTIHGIDLQGNVEWPRGLYILRRHFPRAALAIASHRRYPRHTGIAGSLQDHHAQCEVNFLHLQRLLQSFSAGSRLDVECTTGSAPSQQVGLCVLERSRYTALVYVTQSLPVWGERRIELHVRVYLDVAMAEVVASPPFITRLLARYPYPNPRMLARDEKWQLNRLLGEWLSCCFGMDTSRAATCSRPAAECRRFSWISIPGKYAASSRVAAFRVRDRTDHRYAPRSQARIAPGRHGYRCQPCARDSDGEVGTVSARPPVADRRSLDGPLARFVYASAMRSSNHSVFPGSGFPAITTMSPPCARDCNDGSDMVRSVLVGAWQIILMDSTIPGRVGGRVEAQELQRLDALLRDQPTTSTLVCLHHPPLPIGCAWLDEQRVSNGAELTTLLASHPQVRGVLWGHVHQEFERDAGAIKLMSTPSTCIQFAVGSDSFSLADLAPGMRWLDLYPDGRLTTHVQRLQDVTLDYDRNSSGYE